MQIGQLAQQTGFSRDTIRYYEKIGLITPRMFDKAESGYRYYNHEAIDLLEFVKLAKNYGCTLNEIKSYYQENKGVSYNCELLVPQMKSKVLEINEKMRLLEAQKKRLEEGLELISDLCNIQ